MRNVILGSGFIVYLELLVVAEFDSDAFFFTSGFCFNCVQTPYVCIHNVYAISFFLLRSYCCLCRIARCATVSI